MNYLKHKKGLPNKMSVKQQRDLIENDLQHVERHIFNNVFTA